MTRMTHYPSGVPSWIDLGTPDVHDAARFYGGLFGWDVQMGPPEAGGYALAHLEGVPVAGLGPQMNTEAPPWWQTYVAVADCDAATARIRANGGTIVDDPIDVMDVGRMSVATDPAGAIFSVWQARSHIGAQIVNEPGTLCWNELMTRDVHRSLAFYEAVFQWEPKRHAPDVPSSYVELQLDGRSIAGLMPMIGDMWPAELPNHWMVYFAVSDTNATAAKAAELGGKVVVPPFDTPVGAAAVLNDPQGTAFSVITLTNPLP